MNLIFYKFRLFTFNNLYSLFIVLFLISCYDNRNYKAVSKSTKLINSTETIVKKKSSQNHTLKTLITSKKIQIIKYDSISPSESNNKIDSISSSVLANQNEMVVDSSEIINIINSNNSDIEIVKANKCAIGGY